RRRARRARTGWRNVRATAPRPRARRRSSSPPPSWSCASAAPSEHDLAAHPRTTGVDLRGLSLAAVTGDEIPAEVAPDAVDGAQHLEGLARDVHAAQERSALAVLDPVCLARAEHELAVGIRL